LPPALPSAIKLTWKSAWERHAGPPIS
jgi:hypothetical protein